MKISQKELTITTDGRGFYELTGKLQDAVRESGISAGMCHVFVRHTSASITICENADPDVLLDLESFMSRLVPDGDSMFRHTAEGPDDMPAHVRSILTQSDLNLPISDARCALGTWQGIYLWEHRHAAHSRKVLLTMTGS
ncbi:MAG: secondary thiamine-phosphate synthase enzyme YjbQ [Gammaproteobacteria bacterium]|nr:secondary thiamine-phosphate synthase enzyme YjbQ [Gammaproteobacteria bacterium]MDH4313383.1 secondary thiamine-phosphate synthase enzyme YjbQ [Gammaproteobacteria bacterium]MDH5213704.1 secondary thiamine-phosphate synthase enzyme YjbQ [Gammaproteobacteria bacterium]MDH5501256.1 secondary thiamine-phosphate synthase enzyme YjbQ [Gammaproteobacteria bacterium]